MRIKVILYILVFLLCMTAHAEFENKLTGARTIGLSGAYTAIADDVFTIVHNPGGIAQINERTAGASYTQLFSLDELSRNFITVVQPLKHIGTVGFAYDSFGYSKYLESRYTYTFARNVSKRHFIGFSLNWFTSHIENTPDEIGHTMDIGLVSYMGKRLKIGFTGRNISNIIANEAFDQEYRLGFALMPDTRSTFTVDFILEQSGDDRKPVNFAFGHEIILNGNFAMRAGYQNSPIRLSAGFSAKLRRWLVDYSYQTHQTLDATHNVSMSIKL